MGSRGQTQRFRTPLRRGSANRKLSSSDGAPRRGACLPPGVTLPSFTASSNVPIGALFPEVMKNCGDKLAEYMCDDRQKIAALAAKTGAEVIGVTLQLYDHGAAVGRTGSCCAGQDIRDARAVADRIGIAHYVFDYESAFRDSVLADFADEYMAGRTPIPCVKCNMGVKFTDLFQLARDLGADCLATGHYVQRVEGAQGAELHRAAAPA